MEEEIFSENVLKTIKERNIRELIEVIKALHDECETQQYRHQKVAEYCLRDILEVLNEKSESLLTYQCFMWNIVNILTSSALVRKILWRDASILKTYLYFLEKSIENSNPSLQKLLTNFLSLLLVGAPTHFLEEFGELEIISLLLKVFQTGKYVESTFKAIVGSFGLLSDGTDNCKKQLIDLKVADAVREMGSKHAITDVNFSNLAILTYDDLKRVRLNISNGRQKFLRSQCEEILFCSNPSCVEEQDDVKFKKCSKCKLAFYCSKACQVEHWKASHHNFCLL